MAEKLTYECGPGWKALIDPIVEKIQETGGTVAQVKEKYGTLRIYYFPGDSGNEIDEMIEDAEKKSALTCELCGAPGVTLYKRGWYSTYCQAHAQERGFKEMA